LTYLTIALRSKLKFGCTAEVYRIRISGLEFGRIQHILNKPDRIRTTVLFKFPDQDQDFQILFLEFDANPNKNNFCKDLKDVM